MNRQRYHFTSESRRGHRFANRHYHHHAPPVQVQEIRAHSHSRRDNMHNHPPRVHSNFHARRDNIHDLSSMAFLPEVVSFRYHHIHMQLDINNMSHEDLLTLGQRIDNVKRGSSEEIIARQMRTKTYLLPNNLEGSTSEEQEINLCIICQDEYKNKEEIGILQCGHEYHADCIRRWLQEKNVCPLCKSKVLVIG
ncbi:E3 ubiquitin-protein ligase MBR1-like [Phaseolus vulgaris]